MSANASSIATLQQIIAAAQRELEILGADMTTKTSKTTKTTKTTKTKPSADAEAAPKQKGVGGAHAAWTAKMAVEWAAVKEAYTAERVAKAEAGELFYTAEDTAVKQGKHAVGEAFTVAGAKAGIHLVWGAAQKKLRADEYAAFEATWKEAHPKGSAPASSAASVADDASVASEGSANKRGAKKLAEMTAEERAIHDAKVTARRLAKLAAKDADAPEAAPLVECEEAAPAVEAPAPEAAPAVEAAPAEEDDDGPELLPFKLNGEKYLRLGTATAEGIDWFSGDLWLNKKGTKGDYIGMLGDDGAIDRDAEEPTTC